MKKYLYGKEIYLGDLISGEQGVRFSDIIYYSVMENELMRDDETSKVFHLDKEQYKLEVNGVELDPKDMTANPVITVPVARCYCLCLSNKKNDINLFVRFKADVCIEIDVEQLVHIVELAMSRLPGVNVIHGDVTYYPDIVSSSGPDLSSVAFMKRDVYSVEDEYRIIVSIPEHRKSFKDVEGATLSIFSDEPDDVRHMFINGTISEVNKSYVTDVFRHKA